jgi:ankyrin repeat protein
MNGNSEIVRILLSHNVDANHTSNNCVETPFQMATENSNIETMLLLKDFGVNIHALAHNSKFNMLENYIKKNKENDLEELIPTIITLLDMGITQSKSNIKRIAKSRP